eukprot:179736_1
MSGSLGIPRFGFNEIKTSKSGQSRLSTYLQQLKQPEHNNNNHAKNKTQKQSLKRKLDNALDHQAKPNKKIKLSHTNVSNSTLSIEENTTIQTIDSQQPQSLSIDASEVTEPSQDVPMATPSHIEEDTKSKHHPIYDITSFPQIELPEVVNPEETLMPQPIWMKKGNKIISDISDNAECKESSLNVLRLDTRLIHALKMEGYKSYFPVQMNVIPAVCRGIVQKRDIAVCAPTGSGKTLSYVLPICHILCKELSNTSRTLRALVVSPTRDLALQLFIVCEKFANCVGLKVGLSAGQRSFKDEQSLIMDQNTSTEKTAIDILICTPGRLVDHLNHTAGFSLKPLQFLVLDEADRLLLEGSYQDWLFRVYHMLDSQRMIERLKHEQIAKQNASNIKYKNKICLTSRKASPYEYKPYLLKILLSATLTHNPKIISSLRLNNPLYFGSSTDKRYLIPSSIQQRFICCFSTDTLCNLISLIDILHQNKQSAVCFCDTVEIVHRLKRLVEIVFNVVHKQALYGLKVAEFSRMVSDRQRPHILRQFRANKINFLICSDAMSRGLDLPSLDCVINYQCVKNVETYVHRIGRTARGVGSGTAYTILRKKDKKVIRGMLSCVENGDQLKEYDMNMKVIRFHRKYMDQYTQLLQKVLMEEQSCELDHNDSIESANI